MLYTEAQRDETLDLYFNTDRSAREVVGHLGYPSLQGLVNWIRKDQQYEDKPTSHYLRRPFKMRYEAIRLHLEDGARR